MATSPGGCRQSLTPATPDATACPRPLVTLYLSVATRGLPRVSHRSSRKPLEPAKVRTFPFSRRPQAKSGRLYSPAGLGRCPDVCTHQQVSVNVQTFPLARRPQTMSKRLHSLAGLRRCPDGSLTHRPQTLSRRFHSLAGFRRCQSGFTHSPASGIVQTFPLVRGTQAMCKRFPPPRMRFPNWRR
jgi:hypothetical protein